MNLTPRIPRNAMSAALVGAVLVAAAPAASGGSSPVRSDAVYQSTGDARLTFVPLTTRGNGRTLLKLHAELRCEDQDVIGDVLVTVDTDGELDLETDSFVSTKDIGSETEVTVSGKFGRSSAKGTVDVHARAYDEEGTTAECDRKISWRARSIEESALERIDGFVPTGDDDQVAAFGDAAYLVRDPGDEPSVLRRIDLDRGDEAWTQEVEDLDHVAAGASSVWGASGFLGQVLGFDASDGEPIGELEVPRDFEAITGDSPVAVTADAVWVALAPGTVTRLDPESAEVEAEIDVGEADGDVSVVATDTDLVAVVEIHDDSTSPPENYIQLARIDMETNEVVAESEVTGQVTALAIAGETLTVARFDEPIARFDLDSLEELDEVDVIGESMVGAGSETWIATDDGLVVLDDAGETVLELPALTGELAVAGDLVILLDRGAQGLVLLNAETSTGTR